MTITAFVKRIEGQRDRASMSQPVALEAEASTPAEAIQQLRELACDHFSQGQFVEFSVPGSAEPNPWLQFAGIWRDNPDLEEFRKAVAEYRRQIDEDENVP